MNVIFDCSCNCNTRTALKFNNVGIHHCAVAATSNHYQQQQPQPQPQPQQQSQPRRTTGAIGSNAKLSLVTNVSSAGQLSSQVNVKVTEALMETVTVTSNAVIPTSSLEGN